MLANTNNLIISSSISNKDINKTEHALNHLNNAKNKIDLKKTITTYDRRYNAKEIMLKTEKHQSYYIIRGKTSTFKNKETQMIKKNIEDQKFNISINQTIIKHLQTEEIKEYTNKKREIKIIVN